MRIAVCICQPIRYLPEPAVTPYVKICEVWAAKRMAGARDCISTPLDFPLKNEHAKFFLLQFFCLPYKPPQTGITAFWYTTVRQHTLSLLYKPV